MQAETRSRTLAPPPRALYTDIVVKALAEDLEHGDITTSLTVDPRASGDAVIVAKERLVVAGTFVAQECFRQLDGRIAFTQRSEEGYEVCKGEVVLGLSGRLAAILQGERVALNFLQNLCGIATLTRRFADRLAGSGCRLTDTRKTAPGLRLLQRYAVRAGGGANHRYGLADGVLIKDNHIAACGSITEACIQARIHAPHTLRVEVEVSNLDELREAIDAGADAVLLDNMEPNALKRAVSLARQMAREITLEASGGISLDTVLDVARTGVDIVSVGALTHSARACDLSLRILQS